MNLQTRLIIIFLVIGVLVIGLVGVFLPVTLNQHSLDKVTEITNVQLQLVDYSLSSFVDSTKNHVMELSLNPVVRNPGDDEFTIYLDADPGTFEYHITEEEQQIIDILNGFRITNPYVNSVYMGRENGAFVRSHPRAQNTSYDPRERPWYILAKEHPESVIMTEPYPSVTTNDVNIGVVKALVDENGNVYGVVGADITLANMTSYISGFVPGKHGEIIIVDINGIIISAKDSSSHFTDVEGLLGEKKSEFMSSDNGTLYIDGNYLIHYKSPNLGWKIGLFIPMHEIEAETNETIMSVLTYLILGLILLSVLAQIVMNRNIIRPLSNLTAVSRKIAETGELEQEIPMGGAGEIGVLAGSFRDMIERMKQEEELILQSIKDKDLLIHEIHHRVKNNLAVITGFINMQREGIEDPVVRSVLEDLEKRLMALYATQESVYSYDSFQKINAKMHFYNVISNILMNYSKESRINVDVDAGDLEIDITKTMNTSLVLTEILLISLKESFGDRAEGRIFLKFSRDEGFYEVVFSDDGEELPDIPVLWDLYPMGMRIIDQTVEKGLKGTYELKNTKDARWIIRFPV